MDVRHSWIALALSAICAGADAAPPKQDAPTPAPEAIDVDAMARAKDAGNAASEANPAADAAAAAPAGTPAGVPEPASGSDAIAPAEPASPNAPAAPTSATSTGSEAVMATPPVDAKEKRVAASCDSRAKALLDAAQKGDFAGATKGFDAKMRSALPAPKLKEAWDSLAQFGSLQARGESHPGKGEGYYVVMVPLIFDKANLVAQVACGSDSLVAGFYIKPISAVQ